MKSKGKGKGKGKGNDRAHGKWTTKQLKARNLTCYATGASMVASVRPVGPSKPGVLEIRMMLTVPNPSQTQGMCLGAMTDEPGEVRWAGGYMICHSRAGDRQNGSEVLKSVTTLNFLPSDNNICDAVRTVVKERRGRKISPKIFCQEHGLSMALHGAAIKRFLAAEYDAFALAERKRKGKEDDAPSAKRAKTGGRA